jgi:hypothetical protein
VLTSRGRSARCRIAVLAIAGVALAGLPGCLSQTHRPSAVAANSATLNGALSCRANFDGRWAWQWRELGTSAWATSGASPLDCPRSSRPSFRLANLKPDTTYQYRLLLDVGQRAWLDADGAINGSHWSTVTTQPRCDDVQGPAEPLAAFVRTKPGTPTARRVLCLRGGTQDIGQLDGIPAWTTLTPRGEGDGTKQMAVLNGNVALDNRGAALEDVKVVGCYASPGCRGNRDKVADVTASDTALIHVELTQRNARGDRIQCVHVGSDDGQLTGVRMEYSRAHGCGPRSADHHYHGLYCRDAIGMRILGNWFYDNEGFGVQMYPNCDDAVAMGNVIAMNGGACDLSGTGWSNQTSGAVYRNGFCGLARDSGFAAPIHCYNAGTNQVVDIVAYDPRGSRGVTDCASSQLRQSGTYNADPEFANPARNDFRMRNPFARAKLGIYAESLPGPRW